MSGRGEREFEAIEDCLFVCLFVCNGFFIDNISINYLVRRTSRTPVSAMRRSEGMMIE